MASVDPEITVGENDDPKALPMWLESRTRASLVLSDGSVFQGYSFGHPASTSGEVVFNTGMVGYPESLTDPSYAGQILVITFPLIGNYGVAADERDELGLLRHFESEKIHLKAVVISEYSFVSSHYTANRTLAEWLKQQRIPAIYGVDTRAVTKLIRQHGALLGKVEVQGSAAADTFEFEDPNLTNLSAQVSRTKKQVFLPPPICGSGDGSPEHASAGGEHAVSAKMVSGGTVHILAVDCGIKNNIIRYLVNVLRVKLTVVPWDYDFRNEDFDGLFLSNGPGDPTHCETTIECLRAVMARPSPPPIFGICLGNQLLALAAGGKTYKMKFGNRGMNQPCVDLRTKRCYITPQNHGFAVDTGSLPADWMPLMVNANDGSNEGIIHRMRPWFSVQFHPEARGGPTDTAFLFHTFVRNITEPAATGVTTIPYSLPVHQRKVLVLGSGGLTIGQAGEFDYSGSQAIKALRESGVRSILINPNIATVQTSAGYADKVYFLPVNVDFVTQVIQRERPDGVLCTFGGQTALNCAVKLQELGVFEKYGVRVMGTPIRAIVTTEDRELFAKAVDHCGYKVAESACCSSVDEAAAAAKKIGYPVLVRAAFALGGLGSGFAANDAELRALVNQALVNSPQVIVDKSLKGWKELEYEVVRDASDNCITVCNMENFDPMGIHTGDSIVIAPSQTLTNDEYNKLRECAIKVIRHFGIVGEANIQYALDPKSKTYRIIEVNPRLSRSSALASKATGYPLAYIAAKIALGHDLVSLRNLVTRSTTACFEPSLDYCVVKVPRWDIDKFPTVEKQLGTQMKSVGEVMSIGRSFPEAIQKAMRMVNEGSAGFDGEWYKRCSSTPASGAAAAEALKEELTRATPLRLWAVAQAFDQGMSIAEVHKLTDIDRWFLAKLYSIHSMRMKLCGMGGAGALEGYGGGRELLRRAKQFGFSDKQVATALGGCGERDVLRLREMWRIRPTVKQVDTLAAEFPAQTNYLYLTYVGQDHDVSPLRQETLPAYKDSLYDTAFGKGRLEDEDAFSLPFKSAPSLNKTPKLGPKDSSPLGAVPTAFDRGVSADLAPGEKSSFIVLGSGCYRIGASVEFDWCSVSAVRTLRETGHRAMVINCNPETVSTDYDESDRLYFEELSLETVCEICNFEMPTGVIVSVGGQTPNNLATKLDERGVKIMGTSARSIDTAEDRSKFSAMCDELDIDQPEWSQFVKFEDALAFARAVSFPVLVRPSYVLSGAAMRVIDDEAQLKSFLNTSAVVEQEHPVVISKYISGAREIEFDAVGHKGNLINYAISEHVEDAGTHSGDATLFLPAQRLSMETHRRVMHMATKMCEALQISGPFNVQFLAQEGVASSMRSVKVIECNVRASRTVPFISKTLNVNFIELATRVMLGQDVKPQRVHLLDFDFIACKVAMFSFVRLNGADPKRGVEMQSTGEVACFGKDSHEAFLKGMLAAGLKLPKGPCGILLSLGSKEDKATLTQYLPLLADMGYTLYATSGTAAAGIVAAAGGVRSKAAPWCSGQRHQLRFVGSSLHTGHRGNRLGTRAAGRGQVRFGWVVREDIGHRRLQRASR
uniref:ATP-grasp domain-containing protein n=1 Tax=Zooxanthella nutricula TaxID=1333877 RepID=A0A7S2JZ90_9DINO|mmetsp:Transcript_39187/g.118434  ORF Transcript_39187/g.118434 Transcript_39187/m.118434 type:complete len:1564 (+) Transcript_39187:78-4769(+)